MYEKARELAKALTDAGQNEYEAVFSNAIDPDEKVVVLVVRGREGDPRIRDITEASKAVAKPAGKVCPRCGGTGRIR